MAGNSSSNLDLSPELNLYMVIEEVLGRHYINVVDRFQLNFTPNCVKNLEDCHRLHSKKGEMHIHHVDYTATSDAKQLLKVDKPHRFLMLISNMTLSNHFPGTEILLSILELILTINTPSHKEYVTKQIIWQSCSLFENILRHFPPCWHEVRSKYFALLLDPVRIDFPKNDYDCRDGIFKLCLNMLDNVLQTMDDPEKSFSNQSHMESFLSIPDFYSYEKKVAQKYDIDLIPRDEKITRIFFVLNLLIKLMEWDLAMWSLRHTRNINIAISDETRMPLLVALLWPRGDCGDINLLAKKILELFVICIKIGMPQDKIDILARFVNIMCHAVNLCEMQPDPKKTEFPTIKSYTETLASEIRKIIQKIDKVSVDLYLAVIYNIRAHFIRLLLIDHLLSKFNPHNMKICMKKIYMNMDRKRWTECLPDGCRNRFQFKGNDASQSIRYPVYDPKTHVKQKESDIFMNDYLELVLTFFKSYLFVYRTNDILKQNVQPIDDRTERHKTLIEKKISKFEPKKFDFEQLACDIDKLSAEFMREKARKYEILYTKPNLQFSGILVNSAIALSYRDDIKWLLLLAELIKKYHSIYGTIFDDWMGYF